MSENSRVRTGKSAPAGIGTPVAISGLPGARTALPVTVTADDLSRLIWLAKKSRIGLQTLVENLLLDILDHETTRRCHGLWWNVAGSGPHRIRVPKKTATCA